MTCIIHPDAPVIGTCTRCGRAICETCQDSPLGKPLVCNICAPNRPIFSWALVIGVAALCVTACMALTMFGMARLLPGREPTVNVYDGRAWRAYTRADGVQVNSVVAMTVDGRGDVWLAGGAFGGGANRFQRSQGQWIIYSRRQGTLAFSDWTRDVTADGPVVWVATAMGVARFDGENWSAFSIRNGRPMSEVFQETCKGDSSCILSARNGGIKSEAVAALAAGHGHLWAASDEGSLAHFDGVTWTSLAPQEMLGPDPRQGLDKYGDPITALALTGDVLWVGTGAQGVLRYDGRSWQRFDTASGLPENRVRHLATFADRLWVVTSKGVAWTRTQGETTFTAVSSPALSSTFVNGVAGDSKRAFFPTEVGLVSLDLATGAWAVFHRQDGLSGEQCLSVAVDDTGQVWVSTMSPPPLTTSPVLRFVLIGALALSVLLPLGAVAWFLWRRRKKARRLLETRKWAEEFSGPTPDRGESVWAQIADFVFRPELLVLLLIALFLYVLPLLVPVYSNWLRQIGQRLEGFREILFFGAWMLILVWQGGLVALASRRLKRGDYDGALKPIQAGLKIQPRATELLTALMVIYLQQGRLEEAEQVARKRLKLARNDPVSYGNLGCVLAEAGQHTEAQLACQRAIELSAKLSSAYNNLAWSLVLRGEQLERAIGLLNISLKLSRSNELRSACTGTLSLALFKLGRVAEALEKRQEALRLADKSDRPRLAEMHYWLGLIQREAGTTGEALSSFKQVFTLDPHGRYVQKAQQALWEMGVRG